MICEVYGEAIIMLLLLINDQPISHFYLKLWAMSLNSLSFNVSEAFHFEMHNLIYLIFVLLYFVFYLVFHFLLYFMYVCCAHRALLEISFTEQTPCLYNHYNYNKRAWQSITTQYTNSPYSLDIIEYYSACMIL